jgi:signal transduction histidine kinase
MSIRLKLALVISLAMTAATAAAAGAFLSLQYASIRKAQEEKIRIWKANIANIASESLLADDPLMLLDYLQGLRRDYREFLRLRLDSGAGWQDLGSTKTPISAESARVETVTVPASAAEKRNPIRVEIWLSRPVLDASLREAREKLERDLGKTAGGVALLGLILSFPLGWTMTKRILSIETTLREIGAGKAEVRVSVPGSDEVARLAHGVNEMAAKLQELDQLKRTFVASVTHELRSPLGAIESQVKSLLVEPGRLSPEDRDNLQRVMKNVSRLGHFVTNLLDMAKIERGKLDYAPRQVNLSELVENTVLFFRPKATEGKIALDGVIAQSVTLYADPDLVAHVLTNLISNSLKFTRPGGSIRVELKRTQGGVECSVADSGVGIPPEGLARIFQPFERVKNPLRATGVGLGLAISRSIIDMHGGRISAQSQLGRGSRFSFFLPESHDSQRSS